MRLLNNLENKISPIVFEISSSQLTECQAHRLDVLEESKAVMTFLTIMGVMRILCSWRVVIEGKRGRQLLVPEFSKQLSLIRFKR